MDIDEYDFCDEYEHKFNIKYKLQQMFINIFKLK